MHRNKSQCCDLNLHVLQAACEVLVSKMKALRQEVSAQAASAALLHKFNSGATEPTGEVTRQRLLHGLIATQEVSPSC